MRLYIMRIKGHQKPMWKKEKQNKEKKKERKKEGKKSCKNKALEKQFVLENNVKCVFEWDRLKKVSNFAITEHCQIPAITT